MDTKERHVMENNEPHEERLGRVAPDAEALKAQGALRKNGSTKQINKLWLWFGIIVLILILLWWLFSIGTFEAVLGTNNG